MALAEGPRPHGAARRGRRRITALPELERITREAYEAMRSFQASRSPRGNYWNRLLLCWPPIDFQPAQASAVIKHFAHERRPRAQAVQLRLRMREDGEERDRVLRMFNPAGRGVTVEARRPPSPLQPLDDGAQRIISARRRGLVHRPRSSSCSTATSGKRPRRRRGPRPGRPPGRHQHGEHRRRADPQPLERHPEGMLRVALLGDDARAPGSLAEPECARVIAALDLAERLGVPVEWFAVSSGARIAMDSGTEHGLGSGGAAADRQLHPGGRRDQRRRHRHQRRRQPYWNAEATDVLYTPRASS